jgi:hypothetical protein
VPAPGRPKVPLSFLFLDAPAASAAANPLPTKLQPSSTSPHLSTGIHSFFPSSSPSTRSDASTSPRPPKKSTSYQDILVFDPVDGQLSLKRIFLDIRLQGEGRNISGSFGNGISALSSALNAAGATSISLPTGRMSASVSPAPSSGVHGQMQMTNVNSSRSNTSSSKRSSGISQSGTPVEMLPVELVGRESNVATWSLQRQKDWGELKKTVTYGAASQAPIKADRVE